ncbi:hypothetical protein C8J56DRAFT_37887 [Mycena floridula]|nr:hypothetical protein C8J56DRAFT_37887 [Mycena floridula]
MMLESDPYIDYIPLSCVKMLSHDYTSFYNSLPSLGEANDAFINRDQVLAELGPILAKHSDKTTHGTFGLLLIHRHCQLEEGELMVETRNVTQPERDVDCHPTSWTAAGQVLEFSREPTESPPQSLFAELQRVTQTYGLERVLGLCYEDIGNAARVGVERTEGRKNIVEFRDASTEGIDGRVSFQTQWIWTDSGDGSGKQCGGCVCIKVCDAVRHVSRPHECATPPKCPLTAQVMVG